MTIQFERESLAALRSVASSEELMEEPIERVVTGTKGSMRDIVTNLDTMIEKHICAVLMETAYPILSEEAYTPDAELPPMDAPFWVVDPIDGTVNFASGMPYYAVSVGLWDGTGFGVGAVSMPAFKEIFFTHGNEAAFLNGKHLKAQPSTLQDALIGVSLPGRMQPGGPPHYEIFARVNESSRGCLRLGSAAALLCLTACGRLQGAYGFNAKLWDVGGGLAIASRAGCEVWTRFHPGHATLDYLVTAPGVLEPLMALVLPDPSTLGAKS
ncbi:inositol monophosphatase [Geothrix sp. 21YS21S-2]|uniref:inositol monophosphatase family protein n=1 Tax=Geothrix sp. 21YS21S-2 TaxID=3068893 RepID=UPI0027B93B57|nr:inositol monophosphatase [Geothrix sp. 21YS21S-2]